MSTPVTKKPWIPAELAPKVPMRLVDQVKILLFECWPEDVDDLQAKATTQTDEESVNGKVDYDLFDVAKVLLARAQEHHPEWEAAQVRPARIRSKLTYAKKHNGIDPESMDQLRVAYEEAQALAASTPAEPAAGPTGPDLDSQHTEV